MGDRGGVDGNDVNTVLIYEILRKHIYICTHIPFVVEKTKY